MNPVSFKRFFGLFFCCFVIKDLFFNDIRYTTLLVGWMLINIVSHVSPETGFWLKPVSLKLKWRNFPVFEWFACKLTELDRCLSILLLRNWKWFSNNKEKLYRTPPITLAWRFVIWILRRSLFLIIFIYQTNHLEMYSIKMTWDANKYLKHTQKYVKSMCVTYTHF